MAKIIPNYIEMKAHDLPTSKLFYSKALGLEFTDYGDSYSCDERGPTFVAIAAGDTPAAPMPIFESDNLEESITAVRKSGASIVTEIFDYPGGRRFEYLDPSGNRIAIYQNNMN